MPETQPKNDYNIVNAESNAKKDIKRKRTKTHDKHHADEVTFIPNSTTKYEKRTVNINFSKIRSNLKLKVLVLKFWKNSENFVNHPKRTAGIKISVLLISRLNVSF